MPDKFSNDVNSFNLEFTISLWLCRTTSREMKRLQIKLTHKKSPPGDENSHSRLYDCSEIVAILCVAILFNKPDVLASHQQYLFAWLQVEIIHCKIGFVVLERIFFVFNLFIRYHVKELLSVRRFESSFWKKFIAEKMLE